MEPTKDDVLLQSFAEGSYDSSQATTAGAPEAVPEETTAGTVTPPGPPQGEERVNSTEGSPQWAPNPDAAPFVPGVGLEESASGVFDYQEGGGYDQYADNYFNWQPSPEDAASGNVMQQQQQQDWPAYGITNGESDQPDPGKYKTRLCWHFMDKGACIRGDQCNFAHGEDELHVPKTGGGGLETLPPPSPQSCGMEKDSPRAALLTLCGAWGALAIRKPLARSTLLEYHQLSLNGLPVPPAELQLLRSVHINNVETPKKPSRKSTEDSTPSCAGRSPASQGTKEKKKKKKDSIDSKDSSKEKNDTEGNGTEKGKRRRRRGR